MSAKGQKRALSVRVTTPFLFSSPPNCPTTDKYQEGKRYPRVDARRQGAESESKNRKYHRQVILTGIETVGASATPRVQNARSPHPKEARTQTAARNDTAAKMVTKIASFGSHHALHAATLLDTNSVLAMRPIQENCSQPQRATRPRKQGSLLRWLCKLSASVALKNWHF